VPLPVETLLNREGRLGISRAKVAVLPDDPVAGAPGVLVAQTREELLGLVLTHTATAARELHETLRKLKAA